MKSQAEESNDTAANKAASSSLEDELLDAINKRDLIQVEQIVRNNPNINLNCIDKDELSPLQHACHLGDLDLARLLIDHGADVNLTQRKDGYTALMFAAISSKADIVCLLLERGVDITAENCVNRTAAQMAAFVGQSKIVSIINCWISFESSIEPYTRIREFEDQPRIATKSLGHLLHKYIVLPSYHPVKFMMLIKENLDLIKFGPQLVFVLDDLCSRATKPPRSDETLAMKYHYLSYILNCCHKAYSSKRSGNKTESNLTYDKAAAEKTVEILIRRLVCRNNPKEVEPITPQLDWFVTECLFKFPYTQLAVFKTTTFALSKRESGDLSAYSVLTQSLNGPRMFGHSAEVCSICSEIDKNKKCSKCKAVYYCSQSCQLADWFQHKKVCKSPEEIPLLKADHLNVDF